MYCYHHTNLVYSMAFYVNVIYLNLVSCMVQHSRADTLGQRVANVPCGLSLTKPQDTEKEIKWWSLSKSSNLEKFHSVWCEMTYPWWCRTVVAAGLFHSDPKGCSRLMAPWIHAFQATGLRTKSLLYPGLVRVIYIIWEEEEWFSDRSSPLKTAKWIYNLCYSPDIIRIINS
jgi:hypothetical protein